MVHDKTSPEFAINLDKKDSLNGFRNRFYFLPNKSYMDGNSLGLLSREAEASVSKILNQWKKLGIDGWLQAVPPWFDYAETLGRQVAELVGVKPEEVI